MAKQFVLALDQGTTGSRAFLFDRHGRVVASAYKEFKQYYPQPGWVEHDPEEIWESCLAVMRQAIRRANIKSSQVLSIGITNQRETVVAWHRHTSKPLHPAIVWQCRRTHDLCQRWKRHEPLIRQKTGLVLDPYFSGTKIKWLLDNVKGLKEKAMQDKVCFGTIDAWLIWKLTGGQSFTTDMTNASRTLLFNIKTKKWDAALMKIFGVSESCLPKVQESGSHFGETVSGFGLTKGIPITAVLGDQQAALYGQGCFKSGSIKNTYGTGCFLVLNTGKKLTRSRRGLLTTIASDARGKPVYALEGAVFIAGAVVQWLRDELQLIKRASDSEALVKGVQDTGGVYVVPAFTGLGAPYWRADARGVIVGLTRGSNKKQLVRAALESIAYQTRDVFEAMQADFSKRIATLNVDGGACQNEFLMQFQSDMLGRTINRPQMIDSTVLGAALLSGVVSGSWSTRDVSRLRRTQKVFKPTMLKKQADQLYAGWQQAVSKA